MEGQWNILSIKVIKLCKLSQHAVLTENYLKRWSHIELDGTINQYNCIYWAVLNSHATWENLVYLPGIIEAGDISSEGSTAVLYSEDNDWCKFSGYSAKLLCHLLGKILMRMINFIFDKTEPLYTIIFIEEHILIRIFQTNRLNNKTHGTPSSLPK